MSEDDTYHTIETGRLCIESSSIAFLIFIRFEGPKYSQLLVNHPHYFVTLPLVLFS